MKKNLNSMMFFLLIFLISCSNGSSQSQYLSISRFTDPKDMSVMLDKLSDDIISICEIAEQQMVHHNLLVYHNIPYRRNEGFPPYMPRLLEKLKEDKPHNIYDKRSIKNRLVSSCIVESHFLAGLLGHKNIPARTRAGYFKDVSVNPKHITNFWEKNFRGRGVMGDLLANDPKGWEKWVDSITGSQIDVNHYIEHWICEYWDKEMNKWRILDANTTFLKAACGIEVGYLLPDKHFEYSFDSWKKMRSDNNFNPDQYREDEQDGRFHIRKSMLYDFYSLLNHDIAGVDIPNGDGREFLYKSFNEVSTEELKELDQLANLLSINPSVLELIEFYKKSATLQLKEVENDPYSFISKAEKNQNENKN